MIRSEAGDGYTYVRGPTRRQEPQIWSPSDAHVPPDIQDLVLRCPFRQATKPNIYPGIRDVHALHCDFGQPFRKVWIEQEQAVRRIWMNAQQCLNYFEWG